MILVVNGLVFFVDLGYTFSERQLFKYQQRIFVSEAFLLMRR